MDNRADTKPSCVIEEIPDEPGSQAHEVAGTAAAAEEPVCSASENAEGATSTPAGDPEPATPPEAPEVGPQEWLPSPEEQRLLEQAEAFKAEGNQFYGQERFEEAIEKYWQVCLGLGYKNGSAAASSLMVANNKYSSSWVQLACPEVHACNANTITCKVHEPWQLCASHCLLAWSPYQQYSSSTA